MSIRTAGIVTLCVTMCLIWAISLTIDVTSQHVYERCLILEDVHTDTQAVEAEAYCSKYLISR